MFVNIATQFVTHRSSLESDLQEHIDVMSGALESIDGKVSVMKAVMGMVFDEIQSPEEEELATFVRHLGGIESVLESDERLRAILSRQQFDVEKGSGQMPKSSMTLAMFKKELFKDVEVILAENTKAFEQKFKANVSLLRGLKVPMQRQSDREIDLLTGKHKRPPGKTHLDTVSLSLHSRTHLPQGSAISTSFSSGEMAAAVQASQAYQPGKVERTLNTIGMYPEILSTDVDFFLGEKVATVSKNQAVSTMQDVASQAFDTLKGQVSHFVETSKILVQVLDEVAKVHPFIQGTSCSVLNLSSNNSPISL